MDVKIECACLPDGTRHPDGDTLTFRDRFGFRAAAAVRNDVLLLRSMDPDASAGEHLALLTEGYITLGIESWTLRDDKGKPLPVTRANIRDRILGNWALAMTVADYADDLYAEQVMLPLLARGSSSSPPTPTDTSTSRRTGSQPRPRKHSKPSSTTSSRTDGIGTMSSSLAGVSSFSPSSESAA